LRDPAATGERINLGIRVFDLGFALRRFQQRSSSNHQSEIINPKFLPAPFA
jgi:hypothetical protein